jgi:pilus assembly protein CpaB
MLPLPRPTSRRVRVACWRLRRPLAAGLIAFAAVQLINQLTAPAEPLTPVLVAATEIPCGTPITGSVVTVVELPESLVPATAVTNVADVAGRTAAVDLPTGLPVVAAVLDHPVGSLPAPPGTVVAPVRLTDPGLADLLSVGDRIDVFRPTETGPATLLAARAMVVGTVAGTTGLVSSTSALILVAVAPAEAANIAAVSGGLTAILVR